MNRRTAPSPRGAARVRTSALLAVLCAACGALIPAGRTDSSFLQGWASERPAEAPQARGLSGDAPPDAPAAGAGPLSPREALAAFEIEPGYRIELAASEPLVQDPVAIAFDERGRLYVVENRGYPDPLDGRVGAEPQGVVARLEDRDGDGHFETRTEFARGLTYPNGIMPWDGGVFVTCAPDLLYLKDTDGDGIADLRRVVLTGFNATRTTQIRFSHPTLALDNWVYLTGGLNGGRVTAPDHPDRPAVEFANSDSRFDPRTLAFELTAGQGQFGLTFDDYGRRFVCSNRHPVRHVVLEPRYLAWNPHLSGAQSVHDVSPAGGAARVWPITPDMTTASFHPDLISTPHAGTFTAASGVHIHRGDALPEGHEGSIFVCESAQNLVQRQTRSARGVTFESRPASEGREFLASRDSWFRPVFAANGPDGALYVVDMYRKVIDHPQYVPERSRALLDFEAGRERGRIYRLVRQEWKRPPGAIALDRMSPAELSWALEHPNAWWRETAQRLLIERGNARAVPHLRAVASKGRSGAARVHALWTLHALAALDDANIVEGLRDPEPGVRENAARLAEDRVDRSPEVLTELLRLADDGAERVRLQAAIALGGARDARAIPALAAIARRDGADRWTRTAVLGALEGRADRFLDALAGSPPPSPSAQAAVMQDLARLFGAAEPPARCLELLLRITERRDAPDWQTAALAGLAQGLHARGIRRQGRSTLMSLVDFGSPGAELAERRIGGAGARAALVALDDAAPVESRTAAVALLAHTEPPGGERALQSLLAAREPVELQLAAVRAIAQLSDERAARALVAGDRWPSYTPRVRDAVLSTLLADVRHVHVLLDAVQDGAVPAAALGPSRRARLMNHPDAAAQARARSLLARFTSADRMQVYERLRPQVSPEAGSAARGARIFESRCAACHAFRGTGGELGPDLTGLRNQPADAILLHVLIPDYEIAPGYEGYNVRTEEGKTLFGRLEAETASGLTLTDPASQRHVVPRSRIVSVTASASSLMPNGLEEGLSTGELSDLIAYLKQDGTATGGEGAR